MSDKFKWLQFFADGAAGSGDGGEGAGTGVDAGAADRSLEDLGVPAEKAERFRQRRAKAQPSGTPEPVKPQPAEEPQQPGMSWDDFMGIPENQQRLQAMMSERGKKATEAKNAADAAMNKINPMLELLSAKYGIDAVDGQYDIDKVIAAVTDDDSLYAEKAEALGVDVSVAKQLEQANMERKRAEAREQAMRAEQQKQERDFQLRQHFMKMQQEATKLKELYPDFDLQRELQDPNFLKYTSPDVGMSVTDAFYSIHHDAIMQQQAEALAKKVKADYAATKQSGVRPRENGSAATAAVSATPNIRQMTREERRAYIMNKYGGPG